MRTMWTPSDLSVSCKRPSASTSLGTWSASTRMSSAVTDAVSARSRTATAFVVLSGPSTILGCLSPTRPSPGIPATAAMYESRSREPPRSATHDVPGRSPSPDTSSAMALLSASSASSLRSHHERPGRTNGDSQASPSGADSGASAAIVISYGRSEGDPLSCALRHAAGGHPATARDCIDGDRGEQNTAGDHELHRRLQREQVHAVGDGADDQRPEQSRDHGAATAEQAGATDDGRRDGVEEDVAAAGRLVDRVTTRRRQDASKGGEGRGEDEDGEADADHVDASASSRLLVAADRVEVPPEARPAGDHLEDRDQSEEDDDTKGDTLDGKDTAPVRVHHSHSDQDTGGQDAHPQHIEQQRLGAQPARSAPRSGDEDDQGVGRDDADSDDPAEPHRQQQVDQVDDERVVEVHRAGVAQRVEKRAGEPDEAGESDDERGHSHLGTHEPVEEADERTRADPGENRHRATHPVLDGEHRGDRRAEAADAADREVDLAEQENQHHPDRNDTHRRDLGHEVGEIEGGEEVGVLHLEDDRDQDQPEQHRQGAELPLTDAAAGHGHQTANALLIEDEPRVLPDRSAHAEGFAAGAANPDASEPVMAATT